jgi:glyoxylase-like metal-dependent hydrolase (beta-lactamase superfamily II)
MDLNYWHFGGSDRFEFPDNIVRVTGGRGSECLLIFGDEKTALLDAGMAFSAPKLIDNIHIALLEHGRKKLDYILLSHSHYDHVGGVPYVIKEWPDVKVVAAAKAKKVFQSEGAKKTMERLGKEARDYFGKPEDPYSVEGLRVDVVVKEGDTIDLGGSRFFVLETFGHTDDCLTYILEPQNIMFTSETTGVLRTSHILSPEIVKSYKEAVKSAQKCISYRPKQLIIPHYGILPEDETLKYFAVFLKEAVELKNYVLECYDRGLDFEGVLDAYEDKYWIKTWDETQPKSAFRENAKYCCRNILKEFGRIK